IAKVTIVERSQVSAGSVIERMAVGVGSLKLQSVRHALLDVCLQRMVVRARVGSECRDSSHNDIGSCRRCEGARAVLRKSVGILMVIEESKAPFAAGARERNVDHRLGGMLLLKTKVHLVRVRSF